MGKILNMVPRTLFRKKSVLNEEVKETEIAGCCESNVSVTECKSNADTIIKKTTTVSDDLGTEPLCVEVTNNSQVYTTDCQTILESLSNENLEKKLYNLERNFLFEQNNIIEKFEQEKRDMVDEFKEDKVIMKRAYEHEKTELLKEIERKDRMLEELSKILKEEHEKSIVKLQAEIFNQIYEKFELFKNIKSKLEVIIQNIENTIANNRITFANLDEFKDLKLKYDEFSNMKLDLCCDKILRGENVGTSFSFNRISNHSNQDVRDIISTCATCLKTEKSSKEEEEIMTDETDIQHELAQAYRKQKSELLKLINAEKEEYFTKIEKEKKQLEKEVRIEYESRMVVERKAWQETIEDYEREIAILKYERVQMDRNYCIGMDELKTEFEREKRTLHRSYSETHSELKRSLECAQTMETLAGRYKLKNIQS